MAGNRSSEQGLRERLSQRGEEALGEVAQTLLENPFFNQALQAAFGAREKALQGRQAAMSALNLSSAGEVERLTRRLRSLSERLEGLENGIDRLEQKIAATVRKPAARKPAAKKPAAKKPAARKPAAKARKPAAKKPSARKRS